MVCLRDLNKRKREDWGSSTVREIMRPVEQLATVSPRDEAFEVLALFGQRDVTQLPVVEDDGRLVGLIRREDILKWLSLHAGPGQPMPSPT